MRIMGRRARFSRPRGERTMRLVIPPLAAALERHDGDRISPSRGRPERSLSLETERP
jgi:hypothetical protein